MINYLVLPIGSIPAGILPHDSIYVPGRFVFPKPALEVRIEYSTQNSRIRSLGSRSQILFPSLARYETLLRPSPISRTIGYTRGTGSYNSEVSSAYDGGLRDPNCTRADPAASGICTRKSMLAKSTSSEISGREYHRGTEHGTMKYTHRICRVNVSAIM